MESAGRTLAIEVLAHTHNGNSTAAEFVMRHLLNELLPGDASLEVDEKASKTDFMIEYLTEHIPSEVYRLGKLFAKLGAKGISGTGANIGLTAHVTGKPKSDLTG